MAGDGSSPEWVEIAVTNPGSSAPHDFRLKVPVGTTVGELKQKLQTQYPENPLASAQRLVYAGKVLKDDGARLSTILPKDLEEGAVCTVYLAMKPTTERSSTTAPAPVAPVVSRGPTAASQPAVSEALAPSRQATTMTPPAPTMEGNAGRREEASSTAGVSSHEPARPEGVGIPVPPQFAGNPAMTAAFNAALTALREVGPVEAHPQPSGSSFAGFPPGSFAPVEPLIYMPMILAPPTLGSNNQPGAPPQVHYAPFQLTPVLPVMVPYGVPYLPYGYGIPQPGMQQAPPQQPVPVPPPPAGNGVFGGIHRHVQVQLFGNVGGGGGRARVPNGAGMGPVPAAGAGAGVPPAAAAQRPVRVAMVGFNINIRALLQFLVLGLIVYQHCPPGRFLWVAGGAALLYLAGLAPLRQALNRAMGLGQPPAPAPPAGNAAGGVPPAAQAEGAAAGAEGAGPAPPPQPRAAPRPPGLLREIQAIVIGFFTSLLPGWNMNAEDLAAFAAAQQAAMREADLQGPARDHQD